MAEASYDKECIALAQLETALHLFGEDQDHFSVITLAGAADEILGKLVIARGGQSSLDSLTTASAAIYQHLFNEPGDTKGFADRANRARNALKHIDASGAPTVTLDLWQEAVDMLNRAIDNYWTLKTSLTPAMEAFSRAQRGN